MSLAKIQDVRTTQVLAPIRRPLRNASGFIPSFPVVLIDLVRDDGVVGRAYTQIYFQELLPALEASIQSLATLIKGMPASPRDVYDFLMRRMRLWGVKNTFCTAMGGLDMALWDAWARGRNEPLYATLGAQPRALKPYYSVGLYDEKTVIEVAEEAVAENYPGLKIKGGFPTLAEDIAAISVDFPALGMPSKPTSARTLSSSDKCRASPWVPLVVFRGALFTLLLKRVLPNPPLPPSATIWRWPGSVRSQINSPVSTSWTTVPQGMCTSRSSPDLPVLLRPDPPCPPSALNLRAIRKSASVFSDGSATR